MSESGKIIMETINTYQKKVELKLSSKEYAKGYIYGKMDSINLSNEEYDELSRMVDDNF